MNCTETRQELEALLDNAVDEIRKRSIESHVAACGSCREFLNHLHLLRRVLRENNSINVPASLDRRIMMSYRARHPLRDVGASGFRKTLLTSFRMPTPVFAWILFVAMGAVAVSYWLGKQNGTTIVVTAPQATMQLETPLQGTALHYEVGRYIPHEQRSSLEKTRKTVSLNRHPLVVQNKPQMPQLRSSTTIDVNRATYSTVALLQGFEPITTPNARIIKRGPNK